MLSHTHIFIAFVLITLVSEQFAVGGEGISQHLRLIRIAYDNMDILYAVLFEIFASISGIHRAELKSHNAAVGANSMGPACGRVTDVGTDLKN